MERRRTLILFVKEPRPGRVKTRLARDIGPVAAAWWLRHRIGDLTRRLGRDPRWTLMLAVSPDTARASRALPGRLPRIPQGTGNLGRRMLRALAAAPPGPALLIGADIPGIAPAHVAHGFGLLGPHGAVLGPAEDGGYWLIGLKRTGPALRRDRLDGVRWSTAHALADTRAALAPLGVGLGHRLRDVDRAEDLARAETPTRGAVRSHPRSAAASPLSPPPPRSAP